jgi:hypothetical protein
MSHSAAKLYQGTELRQNTREQRKNGSEGMNSPTGRAWLSQIEGARSSSELVRMLRDYLASLKSEERAQLPRGCAAERITNASDIQEWAVTLAQEDLRSTGSGGMRDAVHQAAIVFAAAGARLGRVAD